MGDRPITGTVDWRRVEIVCDVPRETAVMTLGLHMRGAGKVWMDSAQIESVGKDVPVTDNQIWHSWSFSRPHYTQAVDHLVQREGRETICLSSAIARSSEWFAWDRNDRHIEPYLGKRIKMTAWLKSEDVSDLSGLSIRVLGPGNHDVQPGAALRKVRGTTDWKQYALIVDVPSEAQCICSGVRLYGKGKLWLDDVQFEVLPKAGEP
jgi:hypothetical protein